MGRRLDEGRIRTQELWIEAQDIGDNPPALFAICKAEEGIVGVTEMLALLSEDGADTDVVVPPTIQALLHRTRRGWTDGTGAYFAICDVNDPETCPGQVFIEPDDEGRGLIGYWVLPGARGRGRATRALRLAAVWALNELRLA